MEDVVGISYYILHDRIRRGRTLEQAISFRRKSVPSTILYELKGETRPLPEWSRVLGVSRSTLQSRYRKGISIDVSPRCKRNEDFTPLPKKSKSLPKKSKPWDDPMEMWGVADAQGRIKQDRFYSKSATVALCQKLDKSCPEGAPHKLVFPKLHRFLNRVDPKKVALSDALL